MKHPWQLFCDDFDFACNYINQTLQDSPQAWLGKHGHFAITLRQHAAIQKILNNLNRNQLTGSHINQIRGLKFRVARINNHPNPFEHTMDDDFKNYTNDTIRSSREITLEMRGGIGDYIEDLTLFIPWARENDYKLNLKMAPNRIEIFKQISKKVNCIQDIVHKQEHGLPSYAMRWWVNHYHPKIRLNEWARDEMRRCTSSSHNKLLCCWKAEAFSDPYSGFSRSVPFHLVYKFYKKIKKIKPSASIIDITAWEEHQIKTLQCIGITIINPREGGLSELIKTLNDHLAISIDTALIHLCASNGSPGILIAPFTYDERWMELLNRDGCYKKHIRFVQSKQYGRFDTIIRDLPDHIWQKKS